ncbi:interferon-induced protein 44 isoform X1 [Fundulus heteroclitus]|uniref:interferon-induced protein 44 isoform X1 n=2 Tax=Fundulus heteroclitus TaxID=8078 RepID=UPI00165B771B|nr:interferon-induced protein 44 isoform X1 [Fundulus heteroclitus]
MGKTNFSHVCLHIYFIFPDMGQSQPKPEPPNPIFIKLWREIKWGDNQADLEFVKNYKPEFDDQTLRILLLGPEGAGKSSFINSVQSVLKDRIYSQALADSYSAATSFTREYITYKVHKEGKSFYPFVFCDIMGLSYEQGILEDDVKLALRGHVKEGYKFKPESHLPEGDESYEQVPKPKHKAHILVYVFSADTVECTVEEFIKKTRRIRLDASSQNIAQIAILTKIDKLCPEMKEDIKNVYILRKMKETMEKFSNELGIPMNCIFPVKNYHEEINMNEDINSLILSALKHIIQRGDDYFTFLHSRYEPS